LFSHAFVDEKSVSPSRRGRAIRLLFDVIVFGSLILIFVYFFSLRVDFKQMKLETFIGMLLVYLL